MIFTRLAGGLGNQVFQLAAAMALRSENNQRLLFYTQSIAQYQTKRELDLDRLFDLPNWFDTDVQASWQGRVLSGAMLFRLGRFFPGFGVNDRNFAECLDARQEGRLMSLMLLDGYFQRDWRWSMFDTVRRDLVTWLRTPVASGAKSADFDALLHIRGGDFLTLKNLKDVDCDFYIRGLELLRLRVDIVSVFVVTDDVPYAKKVLDVIAESLPGLCFHLPEQSGDMFDDFMNIRNARSRVIGKSTFSWWAAALDPLEAITIGPKQCILGLDRNLLLPWETVL